MRISASAFLFLFISFQIRIGIQLYSNPIKINSSSSSWKRPPVNISKASTWLLSFWHTQERRLWKPKRSSKRYHQVRDYSNKTTRRKANIRLKKERVLKWLSVADNDEAEEDLYESGDEWFVDQTEEELKEERIQLETVKYGFAMTKSNVFAKLNVKRS